ncbi:type II toxin-antitoxin system HicA family toxin [Candidatus Wolfebacteria bacterium]|nr:type II toxin-antitoxin system HicA family toxin [Candidatus Wolfebacteria bacterium]
MSKLPALKSKKVLKILLNLGFYIYHQRGSHIQLRHCQKRHLRITIPFHIRFDLPASVVNNILKQAEIPKDEFLKLL